MTCPSCGFSNPEGMRFCGRCAHALGNLCPSCGFQNPGDFKFCGNCGASLLAGGEEERAQPEGAPSDRSAIRQEPSEAERRNITVLFADLTGFTSLSEKLDPEDVYRTINRYIEILVERVTKYEGTIDKFTGDGLIALFGAPVAHENDPERAIRAALEAESALAEAAVGLEADLEIRLQARIGINTGPAITGSVGSELGRDRYTALGDTVNVAARLQASAQPGTVLVSESTHRLTFPLFAFASIGALQVKGREEPVVAYEVKGIRTGEVSTRGARGLRAPLIGRDRELQEASDLLARLGSRREGMALLLTGEAGVGKSRLIRELTSASSLRDVRIVKATAAAHDRNVSYAVTASLLRSGFELSDTLPSAQQSRLLRRRLVELDLEPEEYQPYLESALNLPISSPEGRERLAHLHAAQLRQQVFLAARQWLLAGSSRQPLLVLLDDLHWADQLSLDLILFLTPLVEEAPIAFLCASRLQEGEAVDRIHDLAANRLEAHYRRIDLQPLDTAGSRELLLRLLGLNSLPQELEELLVGKAEGNPFFLEELVGVLVDRGIFMPEGEGWSLSREADLAGLEVPATLDGLIMSRVDLLEPQARQALQAAAVLGREFDSRLVETILDSEAVSSVSGLLTELEERGFVHYHPEDSRRDYAFHHGLTRETVYERLLRSRRRELHLRAARGLAALYPAVEEEQPELLAHHLYHSTEPVEALSCALTAGHRARQRFSNRDAEQFYGWVKELLERGGSLQPREAVDLNAGLGDVRNYLGDYVSALDAYQEAIETIRRHPRLASAAELADVTRRVGRTHERRGDYEEAIWWLRLALSHLDEAGEPEDSVARARIYNDLGWVAYRQGQQESAHFWFTRGLAILEGTNHYNETASVYNRLAASYGDRREWDQAWEFALKGLEVRERSGDAAGIIPSLNSLGVIAGIQGEWERSIDYFARGLALAQKGGYLEQAALQQSNIGLTLTSMGRFEEAEASLLSAQLLAERIGHQAYLCMALNNLAQLEYLRGNLGDALQHAQRALATGEKIGSAEQRAETLWLQAMALAGVGDLGEARQLAQASHELSGEIHDPQNEACALRVLGMIERAEGHHAEAQQNLLKSLEIFEELKLRFEMAKTRLELAILYRFLTEQDRSASGFAEARAQLEEALSTLRELGAQHHLSLAEEELRKLEVLEQRSPSDA